MMRANLGCRAAAVLTLTLTLAAANGATAAEPLHFAVGPFQPTATDTKKAYEPFFAYVAKALGADYDVQVSSDWAGLGRHQCLYRRIAVPRAKFAAGRSDHHKNMSASLNAVNMCFPYA
jgi:hypothetical protein